MAKGKGYSDPLVNKIYDRFNKALSQRKSYDDKWRMLDMFYRGEQYEYERIPPWIPKPVTNFIHLVVTTKRAALAMENPTGLLSANSAQDVQAVNELQEIYEWVWKKIKARNVVRQNIETSKLLGTAIAHIYWDENTGVRGGTGALYEGEIRLREIDPANFFPDPNAYCLEECEYIHIVEKKPREWVEKTFGISLKNISGKVEQDEEIYERNRYSDTTGNMVTLHSHYERYWNTDTVKVKEPITEMRPVMITDEMGNEFPDPDGQMTEEVVGEREVDTGEEIGGWAIRCYYMVGDKIIKKVDKLQPNMYPFAILYDYKHRQDFWGKGSAELILENQKLVNKVESIMAMIGTMLQNPQKLIKKGSGINPQKARDYSMAPGMVWVVNDNIPLSDAMQWQDVPQIPQALFNLAEAAKANIREITGLNEAYMGQSVGSLQTSSGVDSLIDRATLRDRDQMVEIEEYIEQLSRLIIAFITTYYVDERYMKIIEDPMRPNDATFKEFIGRQYADIEFDFHIDVSGKAPITYMRRQQEAKELLNLQGQYAFDPPLIKPQEFMHLSDFTNKRDIIDRMNKDEQFNMVQKLTTALQMSQEAMASGLDPAQAAQMAVQQVMQMQAGQAPVDPFNPSGSPATMAGVGQGIGSAANNLNSGQIQQQQAQLPPTNAGY